MRWTTALLSTGLLLAASQASAQDAVAGKAVFSGRCGACHQTADAKSTAIAPSLRGVFGRKIATLPDFPYSDALKTKGAGRKWTAAELDTYLSSPPRYDPGGKMFMAVTDPTDRANVIAYLKTAK